MNYDRIILEMLDRIKTLEEKIDALTSSKTNIIEKEENKQKTANITYTQRTIDYIEGCKKKAKAAGDTEITLIANDVQKAVGLKNRIVIICNAMRKCMHDNDEVLQDTPSGFSTTVKIKYYLS